LIRDGQAIADEFFADGLAEEGDPPTTTRVLRTLGESFRNYEVVARREAELRGELGRLWDPGPEVLIRVPNLDADVADVAGLARIGEVLFGHRLPR
jgi:hypothetical protein